MGIRDEIDEAIAGWVYRGFRPTAIVCTNDVAVAITNFEAEGGFHRGLQPIICLGPKGTWGLVTETPWSGTAQPQTNDNVEKVLA